MYNGERCSICGAPISENNTDGIGYECRASLRLAKYRAFMSVDANRLEFYLIEARAVKDTFLKTFENTKFRSEFKKSFYSSMLTAERISKKQLEIMYNWLQYNYNVYGELSESIKAEKDNFIKIGCSSQSVTREQIEEARKYIRS